MTPRRIVLHPGFHKTGTTSIQRFLFENRAVIFPTHAIGLNWRFRNLIHATRGYSRRHDADRLEMAALRFAHFIAGLDLPPGRGLVISAEGLSGHMPGSDAVPDYRALTVLLPEFVAVLETAFGKGFELAVLLTTRSPEAWLDSAWAELVKASRMQLDLDTFRDRYAAAADLDTIAARTAEAIAPYPVTTARLEDSAQLPFGPATPLVDLMGLPDGARARLRQVAGRDNIRPAAAVLDELLALNRSELNHPTLVAEKRAVLSRETSG